MLIGVCIPVQAVLAVKQPMISTIVLLFLLLFACLLLLSTVVQTASKHHARTISRDPFILQVQYAEVL